MSAVTTELPVELRLGAQLKLEAHSSANKSQTGSMGGGRIEVVAFVKERSERTSDRRSSSIETEARPAVTGGPTPAIRAKIYSCRIDCGIPSKLTSISVRVERYAGSRYLS